MIKHPLDKITIRGYKSINELVDFELGKLNVLIGSNGAGKSNFISLFKCLNEMVEGRFQSFVQKNGGAQNLLYYGAKHTDFMEIKLAFGQNGYYAKLVPSDNDSLFFETETCYFQGQGYPRPYEVTISTSSKESGLVKSQLQPVAQKVKNSLISWRLYHFHDTSDTSPMKKSNNISDNMVFRPDASNLAAYLYLLKQKYPDDYANIVDIIGMVAPFFEDFMLRPNPVNPESIKLEWKHKDSDSYFDVTSLSDGTLRFICLAVLLLQPKDNLPSTILLDEPELGLHPFAITVLSNMLQSSATRTQLIVSTQSVTLINQLTPDHIIVVDRDTQQSTFRRLTKDEMQHWIDDYGLGDLWEKNILGGRP